MFLILTSLVGCSKKEQSSTNVETSNKFEPISLTCEVTDSYHLKGSNFSPNEQESTEKSVKSIVLTYETQNITEHFVSFFDKSGKLSEKGIKEDRKVWVMNVNNNIKISQQDLDTIIEDQKDYSERQSVSLDETSITGISTIDTKHYSKNKLKRLEMFKVFINRVTGEVNIIDTDISEENGVKNSTNVESNGFCKKSEPKF